MGRLSLGRGRGEVRVDSNAPLAASEPLTLILSPYRKGRGEKKGAERAYGVFTTKLGSGSLVLICVLTC